MSLEVPLAAGPEPASHCNRPQRIATYRIIIGRGRLAQLEERLVRNEEAAGSSPAPSTIPLNNLRVSPPL
jgi:hypothetical protein